MELCMAIDIFREDYSAVLDLSQVDITDSATLGKDVSNLWSYRNMAYKEKILETDFIYGEYDVNQTLVPYTWGDNVETPEYDIVEKSAQEDNTDIPKPKTLNVDFPDCLKIYAISINTNNYYRSCIVVIHNDQALTYSIDMLMAYVWALWAGMTNHEEYETLLSTMTFMGWKTTINLDSRRLKYTRLL
jgi:hypothetical protein